MSAQWWAILAPPLPGFGWKCSQYCIIDPLLLLLLLPSPFLPQVLIPRTLPNKVPDKLFLNECFLGNPTCNTHLIVTFFKMFVFIISTFSAQTHSVTFCKVFSSFNTLLKIPPRKIIHGLFIINTQDTLGLSRSFKITQNCYLFPPFYFSFLEHYFIYVFWDWHVLLLYLK